MIHVAQIQCIILDVCKNLTDHLISTILTPCLMRLTNKCRRNEYCYANGPKIKITASPNDICQIRVQIIWALCNFFIWGMCIEISLLNIFLVNLIK